MILTASRGKPFKEPFSFKNEKGQPVAIPPGEFVLVLEHGEFLTEYRNLAKTRSTVTWNLTANETEALPYDSLYYTLNLNGEPVDRGILRVQ